MRESEENSGNNLSNDLRFSHNYQYFSQRYKVFQPFDSMIHNRLAGISINNLYEEMTIPWNRKDNEEKAKEEYKLFLDSTKRLIEKWVNLNNLLPFLRISSECCYRARIEQDVVAVSFVDGMVCLEASLNEEPTDVKFKLSMRGVSIFGLNGFDTSKAFRGLLELCNLRSSIVHGSKKRPKVEDRLEPIVYARGCLTSFYILFFIP